MPPVTSPSPLNSATPRRISGPNSTRATSLMRIGVPFHPCQAAVFQCRRSFGYSHTPADQIVFARELHNAPADQIVFARELHNAPADFTVAVVDRGRVIRESDLAVIRALIEQYPTASRRRLSRELCEIWNWMQPNGAACDMICRGLMLALERAGHIALPPVRSKPINPLVSRPRPPLIKTDTTPIECDLKDLGPLQFRLVRRTPGEALFNRPNGNHH